MSAHFIKKAGMKKDNKLPLYQLFQKIRNNYMLKGKKPLAQQLNNVMQQSNVIILQKGS